jgi:hypothetical protein
MAELLAVQETIAGLPKVDTYDIVKPIIDALLLMLDPNSGLGACITWC